MSAKKAMPVLIVDDSITVRMNLAYNLSTQGFSPVLCESAEAAREQLKINNFVLIILDVLMPGTDGIELLEEIKKDPRTSSIPVMILSAETEVAKRVRGVNRGADEYIGKPFDVNHVVSRACEMTKMWNVEQLRREKPLVVLIDDNLKYRGRLKRALMDANYEVLECSTGEEGLRLTSDSRPNAVIVKNTLAGIDGGTVILRLRLDPALRKIPCMLVADPDVVKDEVRVLDIGADRQINRNESAAVIVSKLGALLRSLHTDENLNSSKGSNSPKRVMVVDDSMTQLQEIASQLRQDGYDVVTAQSGAEALELLAAQPVECILLDRNMPDMSGDETCSRIKASTKWRDIPVVMVTAAEDHDTMIASFNAGADDFIAKSSDFDVLRARLRAQIRRKQIEDENLSIREELLRKAAELAQASVSRELAETRAKMFDEEQAARKHAEQMEQRMQFLYSVTGDLVTGLEDYEAKLQKLATLVVPTLADCCFIDVLNEMGQIERKACAPVRPREVANVVQRLLDPKVVEGIAGAIATSKSQSGKQISPKLLRGLAIDEEDFKELSKSEFKSYLIVPLKGTDHRVRGAITLLSRRPNFSYEARDQALAEELAYRAGLAEENTRLYKQSQESIQAREEFITVASHELKTPITGLQLVVQLFQKKVKAGKILENGEIVTMLNRCEKHTKYLGHLVSELLDFTKVRVGKVNIEFEEIDLGNLVTEVISRFESELKLEDNSISVKIEDSVVGNWDRYRMEQITTNLISNAIKYGDRKPIEISVSADRAKNLARLTVRDSGIGIDPSMQGKIFERFERAISSTHISGLGLGLYIVKQVVAVQNGTVSVQSTLGEGSVFTVELPLKQIEEKVAGVGGG